MQSGNYNRSPNYGQKTKFQQNAGVFLHSPQNCNANYGIPSSHTQCHNTPFIRRNFSTSGNQTMYSQYPMNMPGSNGMTSSSKNPISAAIPPINGFLTGIRSIVNKLNCDFYSDHHRYYNPNYRNNYRMDVPQNFSFFGSNPIRVCPPETSHFHQTVLYNLSSVEQKQQSLNDSHHNTKGTPRHNSNEQKFNKINSFTNIPNTTATLPSPTTTQRNQDCTKTITTVPESLNDYNPKVKPMVASTINTEINHRMDSNSPTLPGPMEKQNKKDFKMKTPKMENFALFDEDFPELPPPKVTQTVSAFWAKAKPFLCKKPEMKTAQAQQPTTNSRSSSSSSTSLESLSRSVNDQKLCDLKTTPTFAYCEIILKPQKRQKPTRIFTPPKQKSSCTNESQTTSKISFKGFSFPDYEDGDSDDMFGLFSSTVTSSYCCPIPSTAGSTPFRPTISCHRRPRQISECSDDGFIIFFSNDIPESTGDLFESDDESDGSMLSDESDDDSDSDDDDDADNDDNIYIYDGEHDIDKDEGVDEVDADLLVKKNLKTDQSKICAYLEDSKQPDSGFQERKKVCINPKPNIHVMRAWDFAYRSARKGEWERYARDRTRFKNRIDSLSNILNPILDCAHRGKIYQTRFCDKTENDQGGGGGCKNPLSMSFCQAI